ncbi:MAG: S9 family peptidase [Acidimicrobiales bacterium]
MAATDRREPGPTGLVPPVPARRPHRLEAHGDVRTDEWWWLRHRDDPEVIAHLEAENAYTDSVLAPTGELQDRLFAEIKARVQEDDVSAPGRHGPWWYWVRTTEGQQYAAYYRLADPDRRLAAVEVAAFAAQGAGELLLDENALAEGHDYFALGVFDISGDHATLAYATDFDGSETYTLRFRALGAGGPAGAGGPRELDDVIEGVYYGSAWAGDHRSFFYVRPDEAMRPYQVWRHRLGQPASADAVVWEETDERFFVSVGLSRSERVIVVHSESKMTSEARWIEAGDPEADPVVILPRQQGVEYDVDHAVLGGDDVWVVRTNEGGATNFEVRALRFGAPPGPGQVLVPHRREVKVESVEAFAGHLVVSERAAGLERLRVIALPGAGEGSDHVVDQPEPVYTLTGGTNAEWDTTVVRFGYTSLVTPVSSIDYDMATRDRQVVKTQPVRGGYRSEDYLSERLWATAGDGTEVPISVVRPRHGALDGSAPCLLYGYGSYEITVDPTFSAVRLNLLERGMTFAIAHVRGGGEMGRRWYEEGRLVHKANTFGDFVACAEHLVAAGHTSPGALVIRGGSAGGLLVGAVANMRPDLWRAVVAEVPFVDVVSTMSDETLPLTVTEWEEWGNPLADPEAYRVMRSYSPYDNVGALDYPSMYVTAGLNDPRVGYWEPAKWVARLRDRRTNDRPDRPIVLRTEMGAGHQGPSGRYDTWRDEARVQAFVLTAVGIDR